MPTSAKNVAAGHAMYKAGLHVCLKGDAAKAWIKANPDLVAKALAELYA